MKTLTALTAAAALAMSMSVANAQSSMQKPSAMQKTAATVVGSEAFCSRPRSGSADLNCQFATRAECVQKVGQAGSKRCVPNPQIGTTGAGGSMKK